MSTEPAEFDATGRNAVVIRRSEQPSLSDSSAGDEFAAQPQSSSVAAPLWVIAVILALVGGFFVVRNLPPDFFKSDKQRAEEALERVCRTRAIGC